MVDGFALDQTAVKTVGSIIKVIFCMVI